MDDEFEYITNEQMKTIKQIIKAELENGTSPKFLIGCIYDLYQHYLISEEQEVELYYLVDPMQQYNNVSEYWELVDNNPLMNYCVRESGIKEEII